MRVILEKDLSQQMYMVGSEDLSNSLNSCVFHDVLHVSKILIAVLRYGLASNESKQDSEDSPRASYWETVWFLSPRGRCIVLRP